MTQIMDGLPHQGQRYKEAFAQADDGETPLYMGMRSGDGVGFTMVRPCRCVCVSCWVGCWDRALERRPRPLSSMKTTDNTQI